MTLSIDLLNYLALFTLKATLILVVASWLVELGRGLAAASARGMLGLAVAAVAVLPLLSWLVPELEIALAPAWLAPWAAVPVVMQAGAHLAYNGFVLILLSLYLLVAVWLISHLLIGLISVARTTRGASGVSTRIENLVQDLATRLELTREPRAYLSEQVSTPQTWGYREPVVLLPESAEAWPQARLRRVLTHELAHIKRNDWLVQILLHLAASLLWFIPSVWLTMRRSAWYAELACDDQVVMLEGSRADYASDLLTLTAPDSPRALAVVSLTERSTLYARIRCLLDGSRNRAPAKLTDWLIYCLVGLALLIPLASVHAVVQQNYPQDIVQRRVLIPLIVATDAGPSAPGSANADGLGPAYSSPQALANLKLAPPSPPDYHEEVVVRSWDHRPAAKPQLLDRPAQLDVEPVLAAVPHIAMRGPIPLMTVTPAYPRRALELNREGEVTVSFDIDIDGRVTNLHLVHAEPDSMLFSRAVLNAVQQFRFRPPQVDGVAIMTKNVTETFVFQLRDDSTAEN